MSRLDGTCSGVCGVGPWYADSKLMSAFLVRFEHLINEVLVWQFLRVWVGVCLNLTFSIQ